jgi:hypothetical protein
MPMLERHDSTTAVEERIHLTRVWRRAVATHSPRLLAAKTWIRALHAVAPARPQKSASST